MLRALITDVMPTSNAASSTSYIDLNDHTPNAVTPGGSRCSVTGVKKCFSLAQYACPHFQGVAPSDKVSRCKALYICAKTLFPTVQGML